MSIRASRAGRRRPLPPHHWQLVRGRRLLLLVLLFRAWRWAWGCEPPLCTGAVQEPSSQAANGSSLGVAIVMLSVTVLFTVAQPYRPSASQGIPVPSLSQMLQPLLFALSGCCVLAALYFLARACSIKVSSPSKRPGRPASAGPLATASTDSDQEVVETRP